MGDQTYHIAGDRDPEIKFSGSTKARSRLLIICAVLAILFAITTAVFLALFIYTHVKFADRVDSSPEKIDNPSKAGSGTENMGNPSETTIPAGSASENMGNPSETTSPAGSASENMGNPSETTTPAPPQDAVCSTTDCVVTAARMIGKMNISADPCVDFNEFACGRFISETLLPDGESRWETFKVLGHEHTILMKGIITEETNNDQSNIMSKMRDGYLSCMDEVSWESGGLTDYTNLELAKDWPTINPNWTEDKLLLSAVINKYMNAGISLYSIDAFQDMMNKVTIYIDLPKLGLPREYFSQPRDDPVIMAYEQYLKDHAIALGASDDTASRDAKDVVDLEIALSQITPPKEETQDDRSQYNPTTLKELSILYPELDLFQSAQIIFTQYKTYYLPRNAKLTDDTIIIRYPMCMGNISSVIKQFSNRTLQNLFGFKFAISKLQGLTREMRSIKMRFDKVMYGVTGEIPRWQECVRVVANQFSKDMQTLFNAKTPKDGSKSDVIELIDNLKDAFKQIVVENSWMSQTTKQEVYNKLLVIRLLTYQLTDDAAAEESIVEITKKVAIPEENNVAVRSLMEESDLTKEFNNMLWKHITTRQLTDLHPSIASGGGDKFNPAGQVNAVFKAFANTIGVEPGVVHPPFFSRKSQNYLNYGGLGVILGHEIGHGFDTRGIHYDDKGSLRNWWKESEMKTFLEKVQCLVNQTSGFYQDEIKMHPDNGNFLKLVELFSEVDPVVEEHTMRALRASDKLSVSSVYTKAEVIADHIGIKTSYRAYKDLVRKNGEEPRLPNMDYTPDQLFFLSFSQLWCEKITKEQMVYHTRKESYIPTKYRTITALQNSEDFAKAYNCPRGSYMNPEKKCDVW